MQEKKNGSHLGEHYNRTVKWVSEKDPIFCPYLELVTMGKGMELETTGIFRVYRTQV